MNSSYKLQDDEKLFSKEEKMEISKMSPESDQLFNLLRSIGDQVDFACIPPIIELIEHGASIELIYDSDLINHLLKIAFDKFSTIKQKSDVYISGPKPEIGSQFDDLFRLFILIGSLSDDDFSSKFVAKFQIQNFLKDIVQSIDELHIIRLCIECNYNFVYKKPITSQQFDYKFFILHFYKLYNKQTNKSFPEDNPLPFESLNLVMAYLINHPQWFLEGDQVSRVYYSILTSMDRSYNDTQNPQNYFNQISLILSKLVEILENLPLGITQYFYTEQFISELSNLLQFHPETDILILKCLNNFSSFFQNVYLIIQNEHFMNYEAPDLPQQKLYLKVLNNCIKSIFNESKKKRKIKRPLDAQIFIEKYIPRFVELSNILNDNQDFEVRQLSAILILSLANFTNHTFLKVLTENDRILIPKIIGMLDERNTDYSLLIIGAIYNILNFCITVGQDANEILMQLLENKEEIDIALQEIGREIPKTVNYEKEFQSLYESIGKLFETIES